MISHENRDFLGFYIFLHRFFHEVVYIQILIG